ncbi:hypothetical protein Tco_1325180 [Tanacetum coccineum]
MSDSEDSIVTYTEAPPSPNYVPGPEEPEQAPPLPDYVPGPEHADDEIAAEDQPYVEDALPTVDSPGYVLKSDPEEDPKEDPEEDPADRGDDGDDEDESSDDEEDDDDVDIEEDEEEEEHLALVDSTSLTFPAVEHALSAEETEPFETEESAATPPPHLAYHVTARMLIRDEPPTPFWSEAEIA